MIDRVICRGHICRANPVVFSHERGVLILTREIKNIYLEKALSRTRKYFQHRINSQFNIVP